MAAGQMRVKKQGQGQAKILAIGTANPSNCVYQAAYPDYYFRITSSEHMTELKEKFKRICENSKIKKRNLHLTEEFLKKSSSICAYDLPSLDARQDIKIMETPKLGAEAAKKAIEEWGQPKSKITHLIFHASSGVDMPGADYQLVKLLGLGSSVKRVMLYHLGCYAGGTILRIAKDLAENNVGARVLAVCSEITVDSFRGASDSDISCLVGQAIFGDGAAALIIGAHPDTLLVERPLFELVSAAQTILPNSGGAIVAHLREVGLTFYLSKDLPTLVSDDARITSQVYSGGGARPLALYLSLQCVWVEFAWFTNPTSAGERPHMHFISLWGERMCTTIAHVQVMVHMMAPEAPKHHVGAPCQPLEALNRDKPPVLVAPPAG
ncbi:hypothetical protein SO802_015821 [Lithocarpus litseifolius]|uniref:Chalcone synthase n=1 Tax=Lithocarpus litseifolius TaxID=425828 RepID=A0AAW2CUS0_9ROSI